jgi:hypothetical protein
MSPENKAIIVKRILSQYVCRVSYLFFWEMVVRFDEDPELEGSQKGHEASIRPKTADDHLRKV